MLKSEQLNIKANKDHSYNRSMLPKIKAAKNWRY